MTIAALAGPSALLAAVATVIGALFTLGFGAVVGAWYVLVGVLGLKAGFPDELTALSIAAGAGYIALGYGFWRGNERHPLSIIGGVVLLLASTIFLVWVGLAAIAAYGLSR